MHRDGTIRAVHLPGVTGKASSVTNAAAVTQPVVLLLGRVVHNPYFVNALGFPIPSPEWVISMARKETFLLECPVSVKIVVA
jgi:hypothetical protein